MGLIGAMVLAVIVAFIFAPYRRGNSLVPLIVLFAVLFFAGYAAQFWIVPFGPVMWGVSWFPVLLVILIFALLFSAQPTHRRTPVQSEVTDNAPAIAISVFIWILFLILLAAVIIGIFYPHALNNITK